MRQCDCPGLIVFLHTQPNGAFLLSGIKRTREDVRERAYERNLEEWRKSEREEYMTEGEGRGKGM